MYTHESGKRHLSSENRAEDYLATHAVTALPADDVAAALRVLETIETADLTPLWRQVATDGSGNPIITTATQRLAHSTFTSALHQQGHLRSLRIALTVAHTQSQ